MNRDIILNSIIMLKLLIIYAFLSLGQDDDSFLKYYSSKDTIIISFSEITEVRVFRSNVIYHLTDAAISKLNSIKDKNGVFYYYVKEDDVWVFLQSIHYYSQILPYGYYITVFDDLPVFEDDYVDIGFRIPYWMVKSDGMLKSKYKKILSKPYDDTVFKKLLFEKKMQKIRN